jgi:hypothetical protein
MKKIIIYAGLLLLSLILASCATTPVKMPDKYNLDNVLKEATDITSFRIDSWESIDNQSLIIETDFHNYYLVILHYPAPGLPFAQSIGITGTVHKVAKGFDSIIVTDSGNSEPYIIYKIYKLDSRKQATEIKNRLKKS